MTTELPPLPEPEVPQGYDYGERTYTASQMRAYAAEAVRLALGQPVAEIDSDGVLWINTNPRRLPIGTKLYCAQKDRT